MNVGFGRPRVWRWVIVAVLVSFGLIAGYVVTYTRARAAPVQPISFPHQIMVGKGVTCLFCHADALRSPAAGMPSVEKCMGCHRVIATTLPAIKELAGYWERQEPIPWVRTLRLPRFVNFSHRVHLNQRVPCERCHGDVAKMNEARPVYQIDMAWCLSCHTEQPNAGQLRDCMICHK
jgi:c(7)-type cytochrome triheme protein